MKHLQVKWNRETGKYKKIRILEREDIPIVTPFGWGPFMHTKTYYDFKIKRKSQVYLTCENFKWSWIFTESKWYASSAYVTLFFFSEPYKNIAGVLTISLKCLCYFRIFYSDVMYMLLSLSFLYEASLWLYSFTVIMDVKWT